MYDTTDFPDATIVAVNGVELEVFEAGQEHAGNPIVLCHGWPEHAFSWRHQVSALVDAGHHVIVPNQRGYGNSSHPPLVTDYDIAHLAGDLVGLLDHYGYADATFVGHDWGATVVWALAQLHLERVGELVALSVPYQERGEQPWIEWTEAAFGPEFYFVHFNRQPGVADAVFDEHAEQFLRISGWRQKRCGRLLAPGQNRGHHSGQRGHGRDVVVTVGGITHRHRHSKAPDQTSGSR